MAFPAIPERLRAYFDQHTPGFWSWWQAAKYKLDKYDAYVAFAGNVTHGDLHDHHGGDGADINYAYLTGKPTLGTSAALNVGTTTGTVAAGDDTRFVTGGNAHDHVGGDGAQIDHSGLSNLTTGNPHTQYQLAASLNVLTVVIKTSTYNLTSADHVVIANKGSAMDINLYAATGSGRVHNLKNINIGVVTALPNGGDTIDGSPSQTINQWENLTILDYAAGVWAIL